MTGRSILTALVCLVLSGLASCSRPVTPGVTELLYATPYSPAHPFSRADQVWIAYVEKASGGSLKIRPSWSGAVLSSDQSMVELRHGVADIGLITPIYVNGGAQLIRAQTGFYSGAHTIESQVALYYCLTGSSPEYARELSGLKVLAVQGGSLPGILTRSRPVRTLGDLKGMRLRVPSELTGVLQTLGADPVNMPMGEVYSAMAKGIIDGVIAPPDTFKSLHFAEVAHFYTTLAVPRGAYPARAMAMRRWKTLTQAQQSVMNAAIPVWEAALAREVKASQAVGMKEANAHHLTFIAISPDDQARFDALYIQANEKNAANLSVDGIDGTTVFRTARNSIGPDSQITCRLPAATTIPESARP